MKKPLILAGLVAVAVSVACGGASAPRPAPTPTSPGTSSDLQPLGSREAPSPGAAVAPSSGGAAPSLPPGHPPIGEGAPAAGGTSARARLSGTIAIAAKLTAGPNDVLYVMARKGTATLVVRRIDKPVFPVAFELSESDAMVSGVGFEGPVEVIARLSRTGDAIPAKGDLEGVTKAVAVPASGVRVTIDTVRP